MESYSDYMGGNILLGIINFRRPLRAVRMLRITV